MRWAGATLDRVALGVLALGYSVAHLAPPELAWPVVVAIAAIAVAGAIARSASIVGASVLLVPAAILTRLGVPWPAPLAISGVLYLAVDRMYPGPARASWARLGRLDRRLAIAILGISVIASSSLVLWAHLTGTSLAGFRGQFPDAPVLLLLVALGFAASNALGEELAFRGVIQGALEVTLGSRVGAVIFQGVLFGAGHFYGAPGGWWGVLLAGAWGTALGFVRLSSGGLLAVWIAHVLADLTIVGLIVWS